MNSTLNSELLSSMIKTKRGDKGLRDTAKEIGNISPATLSRVENGNLPDVETYIKLCKWLKVNTEIFVMRKKNNSEIISEKDTLVYQLRSSRELDGETVKAMISMVELAFKKLKKNGR